MPRVNGSLPHPMGMHPTLDAAKAALESTLIPT
jgi:hypothetical protein